MKSTRGDAMPRCDNTGAWRALKSHYDAHGCGLDLRDAFARLPRLAAGGDLEDFDASTAGLIRHSRSA